MILYKIYIPEIIKIEYWNEFGEQYTVIPDDAEIIDKPFTEQSAMDELRKIRNKKLFDSDYTQLPDVGLDSETVMRWQVYRKELRDITDNLIWNVTIWPNKP